MRMVKYLLDFSTTSNAQYGFNGGIIIEDYTDPQSVNGGGSNLMLLNNSSVENEGIRIEEQRAVTARAGSRVYPQSIHQFLKHRFQ